MKAIKEFPGGSNKLDLYNWKYPWGLWRDGQTWLLTQGEDFRPKVTSFRAMCHMQAAWHGLKVRTHTPNGEGGTQIYIQFYKGDE